MRLRRRAQTKVAEGFRSREEMLAFHARCEQLVAETGPARPLSGETPAPVAPAALVEPEADIVAWARADETDADEAATA